MWTFKNLQDQVLGWLDDEGNTGTLLTNIKHSLNTANVMRATEHDWQFMRASTTSSFTCTSATTYNLASNMGKPLYFFNRTSQRFLTQVSDRHLTPLDALGTDPYDGMQHRFILRGPSNSSVSTRTLQFLRPPSSGDVIVYDYFRQPSLMSGDDDVPDIPFPHSALLVWDTLINMKAYLLEPDAITVIMDNQQRALASLYTAFGSSNDTVGAEGEYINYLQF